MVRKVLLVGSSGNVGCATVAALGTKYTDIVRATAGTRKPDSEESKSKLDRDNVSRVKADMNDPTTLGEELTGQDAFFIITPGCETRRQLAMNAIDAAVAAKTPFVLLVSTLIAGTDTVFGRQFGPVEKHLIDSGLAYCILRLPMFIDNMRLQHDSITQGKLVAPCRGDAPHTPVAVMDVGECAAAILANPDAHRMKTYRLTAEPVTYAEMAAGFGRALGRTVEFTQLSYDDAKQAFLAGGLPEWQVDGTLELFRYIDAGSPMANAPNSDIRHLLGRPPTSPEQWMKAVKADFE